MRCKHEIPPEGLELVLGPAAVLCVFCECDAMRAVCDAAEAWRTADVAFREHSFFDTEVRAELRKAATLAEYVLATAVDGLTAHRRNSK